MTTAAPMIMIQARCGSKRLPRKVLADICGEPILAWVVRRCFESRLAGGVAVLTSDLEGDDPVAKLALELGAKLHRGSEEDVLLRYVGAARKFRAPLFVRITADCPFIDPQVIDEVIALYRRHPADYVCVTDYPEGTGSVELLRLSALESTLAETTAADTYYREHVVTYLLEHPDLFEVHTESAPEHLRRPHARFSVDTAEDLDRARGIAAYFYPSRKFYSADVLAWLDGLHPGD